jgi:predicted lipid-binding transport protein (Tim44 family)
VLLGIKMVAAPHFGYQTDLGTYKAWASASPTADQPTSTRPTTSAITRPATSTFSGFLGSIYQGMKINMSGDLSTLIIKMPGLLADLLSTGLLYALLRPRVGRARRGWSCSLRAEPAVIFNSAIWGQTDSLFTLELFSEPCSSSRAASRSGGRS